MHDRTSYDFLFFWEKGNLEQYCLCQLRAILHSNCLRLFPRAMKGVKVGEKKGFHMDL